MQFDDLIARADDATLQELLGGPTLRLINALGPDLRLPSKLKNLLVSMYGKEGLLESAEMRSHLFDLLRPSDARQLAELLGVAEGLDVYDNLREVSIRRGSKREEHLYAFFGLDVPIRETPPRVEGIRSQAPDYGLFSHQRRATRRVTQLLECEPRRVLLHMPTGAGKTRTAMHVIADHLRVQEPGLVVWLAYSEELCEQAAQEFERAWTSLGNRPVAVHRYWGGHELDLGQAKDGILVAGLGKMYSLARQSIFTLGQLGVRTTLVIIDEAHQAIAETYQLVLEALLVHNAKTGLLGLTATPGRTWADIDEDERLAEFFRKQKVILEVEGYENPVDYLTDEGYLARSRFERLFVESGPVLSDSDLARLRDGLDIPEKILRKLAEDEQRNLSIIYRIEELSRRHERVLVFATTVDHSDLIATILQARGLKAFSVTSRTAPNERSRAIEQFRDGSPVPMVLCNYGVLTTGFDAPRTRAVLIARPTKSLVLYSQMIGRAIRGPRAGGNREAEIVTVIDRSLPGFANVAEAFTNWEDVWQ